MTKLASGTPVVFRLDNEDITCKIAGVASDLPHGYLYILETYHDQLLNDFYPYKCFVAHESQLRVKPSDLKV